MIPDDLIHELKQAAKQASESAYCPYSNFPVGAAVLAGEDSIYSAGNVENASYGLTICAERSAVFQAAAKGARRIQAVVVYTPTSTPSMPCGACRQVIHEFGPDALIVSICDGPETVKRHLSELLPDAFGPDSLDNPRPGT
jgi:cytidine deaminase